MSIDEWKTKSSHNKLVQRQAKVAFYIGLYYVIFNVIHLSITMIE